MDVRNLTVTMPEAYAETFYAWHESFVVKGLNDETQEKSGLLEYLAWGSVPGSIYGAFRTGVRSALPAERITVIGPSGGDRRPYGLGARDSPSG